MNPALVGWGSILFLGSAYLRAALSRPTLSRSEAELLFKREDAPRVQFWMALK